MVRRHRIGGLFSLLLPRHDHRFHGVAKSTVGRLLHRSRLAPTALPDTRIVCRVFIQAERGHRNFAGYDARLLPRALFISPYPDALLRPVIFFVVLGIVGVLLALELDAIDDGKRKEELIRGNREFLLKVIESLPYPFYVIDANDYKMKLMNQAASGGRLSRRPFHCYALTDDRQTPCVGPVHVCPLEEVRRTQKTYGRGAHPL